MVVLHSEVVTADTRQSFSGGTKLIISRTVYPEVGKGGDPRFGPSGEVAPQFAVIVAGQLKLNLDLALGEAVPRAVKHLHLHGGGDLLILPGVGRLDPESEVAGLGIIVSSSSPSPSAPTATAGDR
jgi:hypothetical protein